MAYTVPMLYAEQADLDGMYAYWAPFIEEQGSIGITGPASPYVLIISMHPKEAGRPATPWDGDLEDSDMLQALSDDDCDDGDDGDDGDDAPAAATSPLAVAATPDRLRARDSTTVEQRLRLQAAVRASMPRLVPSLAAKSSAGVDEAPIETSKLPTTADVATTGAARARIEEAEETGDGAEESGDRAEESGERVDEIGERADETGQRSEEVVEEATLDPAGGAIVGTAEETVGTAVQEVPGAVEEAPGELLEGLAEEPAAEELENMAVEEPAEELEEMMVVEQEPAGEVEEMMVVEQEPAGEIEEVVAKEPAEVLEELVAEEEPAEEIKGTVAEEEPAEEIEDVVEEEEPAEESSGEAAVVRTASRAGEPADHDTDDNTAELKRGCLRLVSHTETQTRLAWADLSARLSGRRAGPRRYRIVDTALDVGSPGALLALRKLILRRRLATRFLAPVDVRLSSQEEETGPPTDPTAAFVTAWADWQRADTAVDLHYLLTRLKLVAIQRARERYEASRRAAGQPINASVLHPRGGTLRHLFALTHPGSEYTDTAKKRFDGRLRLARRWAELVSSFGDGIIFAVTPPTDPRLGGAQGADALLACMTNGEFDAWSTLLRRHNRHASGRRWDINAAALLDGLLTRWPGVGHPRLAIEVTDVQWIGDHGELGALLLERPPDVASERGLDTPEPDAPSPPPSTRVRRTRRGRRGRLAAVVPDSNDDARDGNNDAARGLAFDGSRPAVSSRPDGFTDRVIERHRGLPPPGSSMFDKLLPPATWSSVALTPLAVAGLPRSPIPAPPDPFDDNDLPTTQPSARSD